MNHKQLLNSLKKLGINDGIADRNASVNGTPAILLRWNGQEEYYTGFGAEGEGQPEYEEWLKKTFNPGA